MRKRQTPRPRNSRGFSLVEMVIVVAILVTVTGIILAGISQMATRNAAVAGKVDTMQETRDFIDQVVRDIHNAGYPSSIVFVGAPPCTGNAGVACGIVSFSNTHVEYEGDLDSSGTVQHIFLNVLPGNGGTCPCTLQRGVLTKATVVANPAAVPTYYTEVNGIINSGNGAGASNYGVTLSGPGNYTAYTTADVFDAYDVNGASISGPCTGAACVSIRSLQISANVVPDYSDLTTKTFPVIVVTSKARLNNSVTIY
jgi:prepilin-type N-terminal cleavage/methylation domain-containing protein